MARGTVYEIETDRDNVGFLDESDLYDLAGYEADYFQNIENETPHPSKVPEAMERLRCLHRNGDQLRRKIHPMDRLYQRRPGSILQSKICHHAENWQQP